MKALRIFFLLLIVSGTLQAQPYRIYLKDKGGQSLTNIDPTDLLSATAVEKRAVRGVALDERDLPVYSAYRDALQQYGLQVEMSSRWFNYIKVADIPDPQLIQDLPFVSRIEQIEPMQLMLSGQQTTSAVDSLIYGFSGNQIEMLNGDYLHNRGYVGQGMRIAVLDAGFQGARNLPGLDSLWADNRVIDSRSFIATDTSVYNGGSHGTTVLGVMAGFVDSFYVGSAWQAEYLLYRTEFEPTETTQEMDNWVAAAERADSMGADIISSSLGYTEFDGGVGDYKYKDLDGNTTIITRAADIAAAKGILVVVSAGNLGDSPWGYISAPADGDSVLAIGAVWPDRSIAPFSGRGPTADGRIKPDVSAQGVNTAILTPAGIGFGNGTSFSCPLISGLAACLWQENPTLTNMQIFNAIRSNASQAFTPNNELGFGIADFRGAQWSIGKEEITTLLPFRVYPNPANDFLEVSTGDLKVLGFTLYNLNGQKLKDYEITDQEVHYLHLPAGTGALILVIKTTDHAYLQKIIRQ